MEYQNVILTEYFLTTMHIQNIILLSIITCYAEEETPPVPLTDLATANIPVSDTDNVTAPSTVPPTTRSTVPINPNAFIMTENITDCSIRRFPYLVSLRMENELHFCSGVLITDVTVMTTASCLYDIDDPGFIYVVAGSSTMNIERYTQTRVADSIHINPGFKSIDKRPYDIGFLVLEERVEMTDGVAIANVSADFSVLENCVIAGYGLTKYTNVQLETATDHLRCLRAEPLDINECLRYAKTSYIASGKRCVRVFAHTEAACSLLQGSPLVCNGLIYGILVNFLHCQGGEAPVYYVNLEQYLNVIEDAMEMEFNDVPSLINNKSIVTSMLILTFYLNTK